MPNRFFRAIAYSLFFLLIVWAVRPIYAQDLPACGAERPTSRTVPWSGSGDRWCLETVVEHPAVGPIGYTSLAAVDAALYAVMPADGALVRIHDTDGDRLPDRAETLADGLVWPTGLTHHAGTLYITAREQLLAYDLADDTLTLLVDDIPAGWTGHPTGSPFVDDGWLYVGAGGDLACTQGRGAVYRYRLADVEEREQVAGGVRAPSAITRHDGRLWVADAGTDTLWPLVEGADYGACSGNTPDLTPIRFDAGAAPIALAPYPAALFPSLSGRLLVAQRGTGGGVVVSGYRVEALDLAAPTDREPVLPLNPAISGITDQRMHIQGSGFYPHHVYGVAVDDNGWIYVSAGNGLIVALRPLG